MAGFYMQILGFSATVQLLSNFEHDSLVWISGGISAQFNNLQNLLFESSSFQLHFVPFVNDLHCNSFKSEQFKGLTLHP